MKMRMNSKTAGIVFLFVCLLVVLFIGQWLYLGGSRYESMESISAAPGAANVIQGAITPSGASVPSGASLVQPAGQAAEGKVVVTKSGKKVIVTPSRIPVDERTGTRKGTNVPKRYITTPVKVAKGNKNALIAATTKAPKPPKTTMQSVQPTLQSVQPTLQSV